MFLFCQRDQTSQPQPPNECNVGEIQSESMKNRPNNFDGCNTREAISTTIQRHDITIAKLFVHFTDGECNKENAAEHLQMKTKVM
jgi:hypothetical protein